MTFNRSLVRVSLCLSIAACAGGGAAATPGAPSRAPSSAPATASAMTFAPELSVELDSMSRRPSGLYVREYTVGDGPVITAGDQVEVRYTVYLTNGTRVDGSDPDKPGYIFYFGRGQVIKGWDEGMIGMRVGGRRQLVIPPALGYGFRKRGEIASNSTLVVALHLVGIVR